MEGAALLENFLVGHVDVFGEGISRLLNVLGGWSKLVSEGGGRLSFKSLYPLLFFCLAQP